MAFDLASISTGPGLRPPRIILLGVEKIGKSTFAAGSEAPIFLPIKGEEGIDDLNVQQFPLIQSVEDIFQAFGTLYTDQHNHGTIVVDSVSTLEALVWKQVCQKHDNAESIEKVGGGYAKGYTEALYVWRTITEALDAIRNQRNMAVILVGHVLVRRFDDPTGPSYDQYQFDIHAKAANLLYRWADVILFCNTKVVVKEKDAGFGKKKGQGIDNSAGARFVYTHKHPSHPGGGRGAYGRLPYELPLSWTSFRDAVATAAAQ